MKSLLAGLCLALPLVSWAFAGDREQPELNSARLLELFEERLLAAPSAGDVAAVTAELERLGESRLPRVRLAQRATWDFDELQAVSLSASVDWGVSDPMAAAQRELTAQRLVLAQHNERVQREARIREFRRTLRLLAHLNEVETLLTHHRTRLLTLRPRLRELEGLDSARDVAGGGVHLDAQRLSYLEMVQALERTRRERDLVQSIVAARVGLDPVDLAGAALGRPPVPPPGSNEVDCLADQEYRSAETQRAQLVLEEARLARKAEESRAMPKVSLDLNGNARYAPTDSSSPWQADVRLALRVALPAASGVNTELGAQVTPSGFTEEISIGWPPAAPVSFDMDAAHQAYRQTLERSQLDALRSLKALQDARDRLRLARAEYSSVGALGPARELGDANAVAQAGIALLNAELEADLAAIEAAVYCPFE